MTELVIMAGSAEPISWTLTDGQQPPMPIDFTVGIWTASLRIKESPTVDATTLMTFAAPSARATLDNSKFTITPDPEVTSVLTWTRAHYDAFLTGPNANSEPVLFDHGSVRVVF